MSFIHPETIQAIGQSIDIHNLLPEAARALAPDVEYRLREVIQEALKFTKHCRRQKLTTEDVNNALRMRNVEPMYGFSHSMDPAKFVRAAGHPELFFVEDPELNFDQASAVATACWPARPPEAPCQTPLSSPPPPLPARSSSARRCRRRPSRCACGRTG
jgi:histone H3/H4